jgi:hypothetical protein
MLDQIDPGQPLLRENILRGRLPAPTVRLDPVVAVSSWNGDPSVLGVWASFRIVYLRLDDCLVAGR